MSAVLEQDSIPTLDFNAPAYVADPYPTLAAVRRSSPVAKGLRRLRPGNVWAITRYDDVLTVLKDPRFSVVPPSTAERTTTLERWMPRTFRLMSESMINKDDPDHYRLRNLVHKAFTPRLIEQLEPSIAETTDELLAGFARDKPVDLIREFALPLPLMVISRMLGVPDKDQLKFRHLMNQLMTGSQGGGIWRAMSTIYSAHRLMGFLDDMLKLRRREPDSGIITALLAAEQAGDRLSPDELLAMIFLLLLAGHETTVNLIANGTLALLDHPDQKQRLIENPALADSAVEELLRYTNPVQFGTVRTALEDITLGGVTLKKSSVVVAMLAAANRDEEVFPDPETLDIARTPNRHLAFGLGIHFCMGAPLARMEGRIAFNKLLERFPNIRLAVPRDQIRWRTSEALRSLESLPVYVA